MRQKVTASRLQQFIKGLAAAVKGPARVYLVGGASAVLLGWRESTIDLDLKIIPDNEILKVIPGVKEKLQINVELASPDDFIPPLPGWEERSQFIQREGSINFFHYDFYSQALAKIERGHKVDLSDVTQMIERGLVKPRRMLELFSMIEDLLYKYPAVDKISFRKAVELVVGEAQANSEKSFDS